jgi:hypothetical protein
MIAALPIFTDLMVLFGLLLMAIAIAMAWKGRKRSV